MAPSKANAAPFAKEERAMCFHGEFLYEAKILDVKPSDDGTSFQYKIHYKGWKATWDDWVAQDRVRKHTLENVEIAQTLQQKAQSVLNASNNKFKAQKGKAGKGKGGGSDFSSARGSEERQPSAAAAGRGPRRNRDYDLETENDFLSRPSIKLVVPDAMKALLVGDWENVTRNNQLVPLPKEFPVCTILADYLSLEKPKRIKGSPEENILEEVVSGLRVYFDKCLGRILLYSFEREQYREMTLDMEKTGGDLAGKTPAEVYGAEHLARLIVSLPELVVQTNMDQQSTNRLREEIVKFSIWLSKTDHATKYFSSNYETPNQAYIDKARGT